MLMVQRNYGKVLTFPEPIEKEIANRTNRTMTHGTNFVDSLRFLVSSLPSLAYNFAEGPLTIVNPKIASCMFCMSMLMMIYCSSTV